jgi:serine/threonine-protein phosphatase 2B regulatory subunit
MGNQIVNADQQQQYTFTKNELKILYKNFLDLDKDKSGLIEPDEFFDVPELRENPIVQRVITVFDKNNDGKISFFEFITGLSALADFSSKEDKIKFAFQIYDSNSDGYLSNGDLFATLKLLCGDNLTDIQIQQAVDRTIVAADMDKDGKISFEEFADFVQDMRVNELFSINIFDT